MASILTNSSSMAALQTLRSISSQMSTTQERISSGLKVGSASDNAAYWSISTTMKAESSSLSVVGEALGMGSSLADIASTATESIVDLLGKIRDRVTAAGESTNDKAKILTELNQLGTQMDQTVKAASFNGQNWLTAEDKTGTTLGTSTAVLSGITGGTLNFITVNLESATGATGNTQAIVDTVKAFTTADLTNAAAVQTTLGKIDDAIAGITELGATFGAASSRIDIQKDFISKLTSAIDRGVGSLVDADMNEESTRLKALQTQQQLAVQSLSIANSSSESILQLFR
ncbi:flagellin [Agrobacterium genomosp. 3 str. CIP 111-78]|uniref:Flagellin n=1 Tax=Agrobacterium tumefaciens TaxID=358 RepID=A0AAE6EN24_AGRTU|nr:MULTISPECIES: flagellin [Agrobacterium tumefaciens complex]MCA2370025.1 flagellin [Agrobacterium tomkonis CIP 111-78]QCM03452.1 flagellin [Agrobacterium tumefaciens]